MSRWKAAALHLSANIVIALLAAILIFGIWYPHPYSQAAGAGKLIVLLLGVDLVLGPLLTLVVFKAGKKGLKFDLTAIIVLQLCAFGYGMHVVAAARPAFVVGAVDRFVLVTANDLDAKDLAKSTQPDYDHIPWTGPRLVGAQIPKDWKSRNDVLFSATAGKDIEMFPQYYVPVASIWESLLKRSSSLSAFKQKHPDASATLDAWLKNHPDHSPQDIAILPLVSRVHTMTMLLDRRNGDVLDALDVKPW